MRDLVPRLLLDDWIADPAEALAREEELLAEVAAGRPPLLRLWRVPRCLVVPRGFARRPGFAAAAAASRAAGWPVLLRGSGGAPVPLDPGTLNVSLVRRQLAGVSLEADYAALLSLLRRALAPFGLPLDQGGVAGAFCDGRFNLTLGGRKLAGTAQRRRPAGEGAAVLAQALLLVGSDVPAGCAALNAFLRGVQVAPVLAERHTTLARHLPLPTELLLRRVVAGVDGRALVCSG